MSSCAARVRSFIHTYHVAQNLYFTKDRKDVNRHHRHVQQLCERDVMESHSREQLAEYDNTNTADPIGSTAMSLEVDSTAQSGRFGPTPAADVPLRPLLYDEPDGMAGVGIYASRLGLDPHDIMLSRHSDPLMSESGVDAKSKHPLGQFITCSFSSV